MSKVNEKITRETVERISEVLRSDVLNHSELWHHDVHSALLPREGERYIDFDKRLMAFLDALAYQYAKQA